MTIFHHRALSGRTHKSIGAIVRFLCRYIGDHRFTRILIDVGNTLLSIYEETFDQFTGEIGRNFLYLRKIIRKEETLSLELLQLQGVLDMIIAAASCGDLADAISPHEATTPKTNHDLVPSESARVEPIISV